MSGHRPIDIFTVHCMATLHCRYSIGFELAKHGQEDLPESWRFCKPVVPDPECTRAGLPSSVNTGWLPLGNGHIAEPQTTENHFRSVSTSSSPTYWCSTTAVSYCQSSWTRPSFWSLQVRLRRNNGTETGHGQANNYRWLFRYLTKRRISKIGNSLHIFAS